MRIQGEAFDLQVSAAATSHDPLHLWASEMAGFKSIKIHWRIDSMVYSCSWLSIRSHENFGENAHSCFMVQFESQSLEMQEDVTNTSFAHAFLCIQNRDRMQE